jgi:hypothetical protein
MQKRRFLTVLVALLATVGLTACGARAQTPGGNGANIEVTAGCGANVKASAVAPGFFSTSRASITLNAEPCGGGRKKKAKPATTPTPTPEPVKPAPKKTPSPVAKQTASGSSLNINATGEAATVLAKKLTGTTEDPCCREEPPAMMHRQSREEHPMPDIAPADIPMPRGRLFDSQMARPTPTPTPTPAPAKPCNCRIR